MDLQSATSQVDVPLEQNIHDGRFQKSVPETDCEKTVYCIETSKTNKRARHDDKQSKTKCLKKPKLTSTQRQSSKLDCNPGLLKTFFILNKFKFNNKYMYVILHIYYTRLTIMSI